MQKIPLELAAPGMKLAKPVINPRGMTLCGAGTELTQELIGRISRMEVRKVTVEGHPVDTGEEEKTLSEQIEELESRFKRVQGDALMTKIKNVLVKQLTERAEEA